MALNRGGLGAAIAAAAAVAGVTAWLVVVAGGDEADAPGAPPADGDVAAVAPDVRADPAPPPAHGARRAGRGDRRRNPEEPPPASDPVTPFRPGEPLPPAGRPDPLGGGANVRIADGTAAGDAVRAKDWTPATSARTPPAVRGPDLPQRTTAATSRDAARDAAAAAAAPGPTRGLLGEYFDVLDGDVDTIPDPRNLAPTMSRIDRTIDFDNDASFAVPFPPETFLVRWTGFLTVPETATYRFTLGSDDGARLVIDGAPVIDQPYLRAYDESRGSAELTAGRHAIEVVFYENRVYASCRLWWDGPGFARRIVGENQLSPPAEFASVTPPAIASLAPGTGFVGDTVTVRGAGFGDGSALRVTFTGVPAEVVEASPTRIVVRVPAGAATGDVVVRAGRLSSRPARFGVQNALGLYAEYFRFDGELLDLPDLGRAAPYFVRLDPNVDFLQDNLWRLPYDPDVFAVRQSGFLYVPADDDYRITLGSDDGARVTLDGAPYLETPGLHPYAEATTTTRLARGFHPIEIEFFENRGAAALALYWQRSGEPERSVVPAGFFFAPPEATDRPVPTLAAVSPAAAEIGGEIEITGTGFGDDAKYVRVLFPGEVWARPSSVAETRLTVRVPYGVEAGSIRVEAGIKSSNARPFALATPQGLTAEYMVFTDKAALEAALADGSVKTRAANVVRVERSWQLPNLAAWKLPFDMPHFVVHWHGTLAVEFPADVEWIVRSSAGAILEVDGAAVVSDPPWHELRERYGRSHLAPGEHRIDLWLARSGDEPRLQLLHTPLGRTEHLPVPARWFLPRAPR